MNNRRRAFTLIELLASLALLSIIVLLLGKVFGNSSRIWKLGNKKVESNISGRVAMEMITRDLSMALIGGVSNAPTLRLQSDKDSFLGGKPESDRLGFVTLNQIAITTNSFNERDFKQVLYRIIPDPARTGRYSLISHYLRSRDNDDFDSVTNLTWWTDWMTHNLTEANSGVIAENVRNFEVFVADSNGVVYSDYDSSVRGIPLYVDLYLEVLGDEDAERASIRGGLDPLVVRATRRYQTRVYLNNRQGYVQQ